MYCFFLFCPSIKTRKSTKNDMMKNDEKQLFNQEHGLPPKKEDAIVMCFINSVPGIKLGGGFKCFLFAPLVGEDFHFALYFSKGLKPPTRKPLLCEKKTCYLF